MRKGIAARASSMDQSASAGTYYVWLRYSRQRHADVTGVQGRRGVSHGLHSYTLRLAVPTAIADAHSCTRAAAQLKSKAAGVPELMMHRTFIKRHAHCHSVP